MGLDVVELVMAVEEEFAIELPYESTSKMRSVGDMVDFVHASANSGTGESDRSQVFEKVADIVAEQLCVDRAIVVDASRFVEELGIE